MPLAPMRKNQIHQIRSTRTTKKFKQHDVLSDEFIQLSRGISLTERDEIIAEILSSDEVQKEFVKRLVVEELRTDVFMRVLGYRTPPHVMAFLMFFRNLRARGHKSGMVLAPRGSGKSTACNTCQSCVEAIADRNKNFLIASRTSDQAQSFLGAIKGNLIKLQIQELFGNLKGEKWDETSASIADKEGTDKEQTFHIAGADGAVVSKHFDKIIADDLVEEKNSSTESARSKLKKFHYKSLLPTLRPQGELWGLGTRYHPDDLYGHWLKTDPMFNKSYFILPAVFDVESGEAVDLEEKEDGTFVVPVGATTWDDDPEGFPSKIVCLRRESMTQGDFDAQFQNKVEILRGDYFTGEWFQHYTEEPTELVKSKGLVVWAGVDLAVSLQQKADEFAIAAVGIQPKTFEVYVLDYLSGRFTIQKQIDIIVDYFDTWDPVRTFIESNAFQAAMQALVQKEFPDVRSFPYYTTKDKITRALGLQVYYERHKMWHRKGRSAKLEKQLAGFPHVDHDDLFDAVDIAIMGALKGQRRRRRTKEPKLW